jgi:hypothetical protein
MHVLYVDVPGLALFQCVAAFSTHTHTHSFFGENLNPLPIVNTSVSVTQTCPTTPYIGACAHELGCVQDPMSMLTCALQAVLHR